jgi:hypothetical protein
VIIELIVNVILQEHARDVRERHVIRDMMAALAPAIGILGKVKEERLGWLLWQLHETLDEEFLQSGGHDDRL